MQEPTTITPAPPAPATPTPARRHSFSLGNLYATPGALALLTEEGKTPDDFLRRHMACDWGEMDAADLAANDCALLDGSRIFSSYKTNSAKLWVITEAADDDGQRIATTILLPEEY